MSGAIAGEEAADSMAIFIQVGELTYSARSAYAKPEDMRKRKIPQRGIFLIAGKRPN